MTSAVHVHADPARAMAEAFVTEAHRLDRAKVALSGGSTPRMFLRLLATEYKDRIQWERLTLFQVDERCVPPVSPESNWKMLQDELLSQVLDVRAFRMEVERPDGDTAYAALLDKYVAHEESPPQFDLVVLGMGSDGHTASLFPGTPALEERDRTVIFSEGPNNSRRMTLTFPVLEAAKKRWFLVRGADKAPAFERVQTGELPAGRLRDSEWFIDPDVRG